MNILKKLSLLSFLTTLFACGGGDGKPGVFSKMGYHIGKEKVWLKSPGTGPILYVAEEVQGADPASFSEKELRNEKGETASFAFDKNHVYWGIRQIEGADLSSFEFVGKSYTKDKNGVYYQEKRFSNDPKHFKILDQNFAADAQYIYFGQDVFSKDVAHFRKIGEQSEFYADSEQCWYNIYAIHEANPKTFHHLKDAYAADDRQVFFEMNPLEGADEKSFQVLGKNYGKDARQVFLKSSAIEGADPLTFRVLSDTYSKDAKKCYAYGFIIPDATADSFEVINEFYAKDAHRVFCSEKVIPGADPKTFVVDDAKAGLSHDHKRKYILTEAQ